MHSQLVMLHANEVQPPHGLDMTAASTINRVEKLATAMHEQGFDPTKPCMIGYFLDDKVQLLSGTHRHRAASIVDRRFPVLVWDHQAVVDAQGNLEKWFEIMREVPLLEALRRVLDETRSYARSTAL